VVAFGVLGLMVAAPWLLPPFYLHMLTLTLVYGAWATSYGLVMGQLGLVSFGHAVVFGGGAYACAWAALNLSDSIFAGLAAGMALGFALGGAMGLVLGRLSGVAFAIGTLAFGGMVAQIANGWVDVTGGSDGLVGLPFPQAFGHALDERALYALALTLALVAVCGLAALLGRRPGLILHAVRDNPVRAESGGFSVYAVRCATLAGSGAVAGLAGALSAYLIGSVAPPAVDWTASGAVLIMTVLGGAATIFGPIAGAAAYTLLEQALSQIFPDYRLILGGLFVAIVLVAPRGVAALRIGKRDV
jgi:branched-chain amino acid transport system permease protein